MSIETVWNIQNQYTSQNLYLATSIQVVHAQGRQYGGTTGLFVPGLGLSYTENIFERPTCALYWGKKKKESWICIVCGFIAALRHL